MWDESWYALNAQEMLEKGNFLEVFLFGKPDFGNTKPPFALWCMLPFIKLFGFNELGIRLASAIFALFSTILLWHNRYPFTYLQQELINHKHNGI